MRTKDGEMLRELLARIHGDGGHYVQEHGIEQSFLDADAKIVHLFQVKEAAESMVEMIDRLRVPMPPMPVARLRIALSPPPPRALRRRRRERGAAARLG